MKIEKIKKIMNKKYSPTEALGYYLSILDSNIEDCSMEEIVALLEQQLLKTESSIEIMEKINIEALHKIINYWSMTIEQVIDYGFIVFNNIIQNSKTINDEVVTDTFIFIMRLYSPDNAVSYTNQKFRKWQVTKDE